MAVQPASSPHASKRPVRRRTSFAERPARPKASGRARITLQAFNAYISDLFVQCEWRRQGIGTARKREFERSMLAKGLHWMTVCVKSKSKTARQAYEKYGFEDYEVILT